MLTTCSRRKPNIDRKTPEFLAELHSGPKGGRAEPHNYRARIEIEKTMRLSFHGHRGNRHGSRARALYIHTYVRANEVAQKGGHTAEKAWPGQASYRIDIDYPPLVKNYLS